MDEQFLNLFEVIEIDSQKKIRFYPNLHPPSEILYNEAETMVVPPLESIAHALHHQLVVALAVVV